jgi:hypothetical protein
MKKGIPPDDYVDRISILVFSTGFKGKVGWRCREFSPLPTPPAQDGKKG